MGFTGVRFSGVGSMGSTVRLTSVGESFAFIERCGTRARSGTRKKTNPYAAIGCLAWVNALTIIYEFKGIHVCIMIDFNENQIIF